MDQKMVEKFLKLKAKLESLEKEQTKKETELAILGDQLREKFNVELSDLSSVLSEKSKEIKDLEGRIEDGINFIEKQIGGIEEEIRKIGC